MGVAEAGTRVANDIASGTLGPGSTLVSRHDDYV